MKIKIVKLSKKKRENLKPQPLIYSGLKLKTTLRFLTCNIKWGKSRAVSAKIGRGMRVTPSYKSSQ